MTQNKRKINHSKIDRELAEKHFRVAIFGSARIKPNDKTYKEVYKLAKEIGQNGWDLVTGGGPGLMEASSAGHEKGVNECGLDADTIGLTIRLPWETKENKHLDIKKHFNRFSDRLDHFMALSNIVVVMPGGIGTCLEFFYTLQLTQVKHICPIPIILHGNMWEKLLEWIKKYPLKKGLISPGEMDNVFVAKNKKEAMKIIKNAHKIYVKQGNDFCINYKKYKLN